MRKTISCTLVVILTFITVVAMFSFKANYTSELLNITEDMPKSQEKPDGTGLIFEDYDKNINLPVNVPKASEGNKNDSKKLQEEKNDRLNMNRINRFKRQYEDYIAFNQLGPEEICQSVRYINNDADLEKYAPKQDKVVSIENKITLEDKVSIAKMAKNLNVNDIDIIRQAIKNGANEYEVRRIWNLLKDKLPEKDYERLVEIVNKYEK